MSVVGLERALHNYTMEPSLVPFDLKSVPLASQPITDQKACEHITVTFLATVGINPSTLCLQGGHANHLTKSPNCQPSS